jgi:hypothetical protein
MEMSTMSEREYLEVTLHTKGGGQIVFAAEKITSRRSTGGDGYTSLEWTSTDFDDLPRLQSVDLPNVAGITVRQIGAQS